MTTPLPDLIERLRVPDQGVNLLEHEMLAEKASSLGHHGRQVEKTLAALRAFEGEGEGRAELVAKAAYAVWAFLVQRELCGLRDQKQIILDYGVPGEVLAQLGVVRR
jgi:hypothetical protein